MIFELSDEYPLPDWEEGKPGKVRAKYPWHNMKVGQSFFAPNMTGQNIGADKAGRRMGVVFTTKECTENGIKGVRVWRVK
jgi:hypothetical protein